MVCHYICAMLVIAHRGASGYAPEHTFAAYDRALALGCDYLEQDLQMTSDGVLVCMHDDTLDRTVTGATGPVSAHTLSEIQHLDAGSWFNRAFPAGADPAFAEERVPTLDAVFARYRERAAFYIETKQPESAPGMERELLRLLDEHGLTDAARSEGRVLIQSFSGASLRLIHALDPALPLIQLLPAGTALRDAHMREIAGYAIGVGPLFRDVDARFVASARTAGLVVHPYTVNKASDMARLIALGVDGMFTNYADRLIDLLPASAPRGIEATRQAYQRARQRTPTR